jgi:transposase-like protein
MRLESVICKYCGSPQIIKYGTFEGMQRHFCKTCRRKFAANRALSKMKTPIWVVASALDSYYNNKSLKEIQDILNERYGATYSVSSIYDWVMRFSAEAVSRAASFKPSTGEVWLAYKTSITVGRRCLWLWDVFDFKTGFLLISRLCGTNDPDVIEMVLGARVSKTPPQQMVVIHSEANGRISESFWFRSPEKALKQQSFRPNSYMNAVNNLSVSIRKRQDILRGVKKPDTLQLLIDAWRVHYNFFMVVDGYLPPAQKMGDAPYREWLDILNSDSDSR